MNATSTGDWQRVADYLRAELARRHMTQRDLAESAGVSTRAVSDLLSGRALRRMPPSAAAVEQSLGWPPGAVRRLLVGGEVEPEQAEPAPRFESDGERDLWNLRTISEDTRRELIAYMRARRRIDETG